jgi:hypothetical protein
MSAFRYHEKPSEWKHGFGCVIDSKPVFFSFVIEESMPKRQSFEPLSYILRDLRNSFRLRMDIDEEEFEDQFE